MFCKQCGNQLSDQAQFCDKCGRPVEGTQPDLSRAPYNPMQVTKRNYNTPCIVGAVIAGISLLLNFYGIVGIAAVIVSVVGLQQASRRQENGKGWAIAGIIVGAFSILYGVYSLMVLATLF